MNCKLIIASDHVKTDDSHCVFVVFSILETLSENILRYISEAKNRTDRKQTILKR